MRITRRHWGETLHGTAWLFEIEGEGLTVRVSNYGGIIQSLPVTGDNGSVYDVVLGYDRLEAYLQSDTFFGAMIGPVADRMAGGRCTLDGREVRLPQNAGPDSMHCADRGFHCVLWDWEILEDGLLLDRIKPEEAGSFPGTMHAEIRIRVPKARLLRLEYAAECSRETAVSFTNHSYFNLSGCRRDCRDHIITLRAGRYAETERDTDPICTGRALPVAGTPLDMRSGTALGCTLGQAGFREIASAGGIDHFFLADGEGLREHARLNCPETGLEMLCRSDAPGLLVYSANGLESEAGKGDRIYGRNWGICLETGRFPNAVNLPEWREQVLLQPGGQYRSVTEFSFSGG